MALKGWHARGYLPHFDSPETIQHIVFRTRGSLPRHVQADFGAALDQSPGGRVFADPDAAAIMQTALLHFDGQRYRLLAWCVMPNHVHTVIEQVDGFQLGSIVKSWKVFVARRLAGNNGPLWAKDYFDRYVRNEADLARVLDYVERNPVSAGLAAAPEDWPFSSASYRRER